MNHLERSHRKPVKGVLGVGLCLLWASQLGKESACNAGNYRRRAFDSWVGKIPQKRKWQPTPVSLPEKSHGQRSLVSHSPWGWKESDTTEGLSTACIHLDATLICLFVSDIVGSISSFSESFFCALVCLIHCCSPSL